MGIETGLANGGNGDLRIARLGIPEREEYEISLRGRRKLFLGIQDDSYSAFWGARILAAQFIGVVSDLGVPKTSEALLYTTRYRTKLTLELADLPSQVGRRRATNFIRVNTPHLDFTWQGEGKGSPKPVIVGLIGDQVDMQVLEEYYVRTTGKLLDEPVSQAVLDLLQRFPTFQAEF